MQTAERGVTVQEVRCWRDSRSERLQIVDVRSAGEFAGGHVAGAINIPMEEIVSRVNDLDHEASLILVCQSGPRSAICREWLTAQGLECRILAGGTNAWVGSGLPLVRSARTRWSIERQVRLGAGLMTLSGALLATLVHPAWLLLCGFAGAGLTGAGLTGFCPMATLLTPMPWNRA